MQPFVRTLPLTALNDALRAVMIDGRPLAQLGAPLAIVTGWGVASFVVALAIFRWR
jgi:ABC-2 type transport system permease protein